MWQALAGAGAGLLGAGATSFFNAKALAGAAKQNQNMGLFQAFGAMNRPDVMNTPTYENVNSEWQNAQRNQAELNRRKLGLDTMQNVVESGGADPFFNQAMESNLSRAGKQIAGRDQALINNAQRRGVAGGGLEFAMRRGNAADSYGTQADIATNIAGQRMNRFDDATRSMTTGAANAIASDDSWAANRANALDAMARFNKENSWNAQMERWRAQNGLSQQKHNEFMNAGTQYGNNNARRQQQFWQNQNETVGALLNAGGQIAGGMAGGG